TKGGFYTQPPLDKRAARASSVPMAVLGSTDSKSPDRKVSGQSAAGPGGANPPSSPPGGAGAGMPAGGAGGNGQAGGLSIAGGAAIVAPLSAFPNGVPPNALIVLPLSAPTAELKAQLEKGPVAVTQDQMWKLLGFNGPAVQVQDEQGRPIAIGLDDLLAGLQKHWDEGPDDLNRGRILPPAPLKYPRPAHPPHLLSPPP